MKQTRQSVHAVKQLIYLDVYAWCHGIQHKDNQYDDLQHNATQHNDIQHKDTQYDDIQYYETQHNDIQYHEAQHNNKKATTSITTAFSTMSQVRCLVLNIVMLSAVILQVIIPTVAMLSVVMLSVVMLSVVMLSVVAPLPSKLACFSLDNFHGIN